MQISMNDVIAEQEVIAIYKANHWSSAEKPKELILVFEDSEEEGHYIETAVQL